MSASLMNLIGEYGAAVRDWAAGDRSAGSRVVTTLAATANRVGQISRAAEAVGIDGEEISALVNGVRDE